MDYTGAMQSSYDGYLAKISDRLRRLADEVERSGKPRNEADYLGAASRVVHDVTWGVANLNLDTLLSWAEQVVVAQQTAAADA